MAILEQAWKEAVAGRPTVVSVEGPPGIGKSLLLRQFTQTLAAEVYEVASDEDDALVPFAVLRPLMAALGAPEALPTQADAVVAGAALLDAVGQVASVGPLALVIEDCHWADRPSLDALAFMFRRLIDDAVLLMISARSGVPMAATASLERLLSRRSARRMELRPFGPDDVLELAAIRGRSVSSLVASVLATQSEGVPLHIDALLRELDDHQLVTSDAYAIPAPRSYAAAVRQRLDSLPRGVIDFVEGASVFTMPITVATAASVAHVRNGLSAAEAAVEAGLLNPLPPGEARVSFPHALTRAAVYQSLAPTKRARLHRRAAELFQDQRHALRHLVAASDGSDADLMAKLVSIGESEVRNGSLPSAISAFLDASRVSPTPAGADDLLLKAAELMISLGDSDGASALLALVDERTPTARRPYIAGAIALFDGRRVEAETLLEEAWEKCDGDQPDVALRVASSLGALHVNQGNAEKALLWSGRARTLGSASSSINALDTTVHTIALILLKRHAEAEQLTRHLPRTTTPDPALDDGLLARGVLALWTGRLLDARDELRAVAAATRRRGPAHGCIMALYYLADAEFRLGHWDASIIAAEQAIALAEAGGLAWTTAIAHAAAAAPLTAMGRLDAADRHVSRALKAAADLSDATAMLWASVAATRLASTRGDPAAPTLLEFAWQLRSAPGLDQPGIQPWLPVYLDALMAAGRKEECQMAADALEAQLSLRPMPGPAAALAKAKTWLLMQGKSHRGAADLALAARAELASGDLPVEPLPMAELCLVAGMALRRAGRRRQAVETLHIARQELTWLGGGPSLTRVDQELAACGLKEVGRLGAPLTAQLSPQEMAVARLAATGLTNRQIAEELVVSVKTVEYHLRNLYPKLGVRGRGGIAEGLKRSAPGGSAAL